MSMTREEACKWFEKNIRSVTMPGAHAAHQAAIVALRPVSRKQVEKVWKGEWEKWNWTNYKCDFYECSKCGTMDQYQPPFCFWCGAAMTDEAVDIVMERLEALRK